MGDYSIPVAAKSAAEISPPRITQDAKSAVAPMGAFFMSPVYGRLDGARQGANEWSLFSALIRGPHFFLTLLPNHRAHHPVHLSLHAHIYCIITLK